LLQVCPIPLLILIMLHRPPTSPLFPYTTLFRSTVFFASFPLGIGAAALQVVVPNRLRGQLSALFLILVSIGGVGLGPTLVALVRSEEHTSELQSRENIVCRLLLEKKNK